MIKVYLSKWRVNAVDREGIENRLLPLLGLIIKHRTTRAAEVSAGRSSYCLKINIQWFSDMEAFYI